MTTQNAPEESIGGVTAPGAAESASAAPVPEPVLTRLRKGHRIRGRHRYLLHHQLGKGAFGTVWAAKTVDADRDAPDVPPPAVAIKFFHATADAESTGFIRRELAALLAMRSECIPRVYDWAVNDRLSFFVMDYYRHGNLADIFRTPGGIDDGEAWVLLVDLLRALGVAHGAGVLHLDIKPSNVMRDGHGGYMLLDFGISQANQVFEGPAQTVGAGSRGYQAPEQRRLELDKLDTRTDLWSVGATVWAARTGWDLARHPEKLVEGAKGTQPSLRPLSLECIGCSDELEGVVMSLLAEDPSERPGGAADVIQDVREATGMTVRDEPGANRRPYTEEEAAEVGASLMDPLWSSLCRRPEFARYLTRFDDGDYLCREGDASHEAFVLLRGRLVIERGGEPIEVDDREGAFVGELATLTGQRRAASIRAEGTTWMCAFNSAEFERLLAAHPAIAIRLVKLMARRLIRQSGTRSSR